VGIFPIDIDLFRKYPKKFEKEFEKRFLDKKVLERARELDKKWREKIKQVNKLRHEINKRSKAIAIIKAFLEKKIKKEEAKEKIRKILERDVEINKKTIEKIKKEVGEIEKKLKVIENETENIRRELYNILLTFPQFSLDKIPIGPDERYNKPIRFWGKPKVWRNYLDQFKEQIDGFDVKYEVIEVKPKHHYDIIKEYDLADTELAGKMAGARFYIEKNELVFLDFALTLYALEFYKKKGFDYVIVPPYLMKRDVEERITHITTFEDAIYTTREDDLILIPTSEHPICAMFIDRVFLERELPLRILAWSPAFRREAGAHGKDTKGIFRTHQFHKVELHSVTTLDQDLEELEYMLKIFEEFNRTLNIPYRVIILSSGDMDKRARIQYDLEAWFPGQGKYRELGSLATMGDWVSRKINTRVERKGKTEFVANLYATGCAIQRTWCAILENNWDPKKNIIKIPKPLWRYTGIKKLYPKASS